MLSPYSRSLPRARCARPRHPVLRIEAILIVHLLLLRIAENVVRFLYFLEAVLGRLVARIQVRVMLAREAAISLADIIRARLASDAERLVVVGLCHIAVSGQRTADRNDPSNLSAGVCP